MEVASLKGVQLQSKYILNVAETFAGPVIRLAAAGPDVTRVVVSESCCPGLVSLGAAA